MEEQGFDAQEESAEENLLQKFIDYVRVCLKIYFRKLQFYIQSNCYVLGNENRFTRRTGRPFSIENTRCH